MNQPTCLPLSQIMTVSGRRERLIQSRQLGDQSLMSRIKLLVFYQNKIAWYALIESSYYRGSRSAHVKGCDAFY